MQAELLVDDAFAQHRAGNLAQAETLYRAALAIQADNLDALQLLGALVLGTQRAQEAAMLLQQAADLLARRDSVAPGYAALYNNLATALGELGRHAEAVGACRRALALRPDDFTALTTLGHLLVTLDRLDEAVEAFRAAAAANPQSWPAYLKLSQTLALAGRHDDAAALLEQLAEALPEDMTILRELVQAEFASGHLDAAQSACERVLARQPDDADAQVFAGRIHHAQKRPEQAEAAYRAALGLRHDDVTALSHLALLLEEQDRMAEAAKICRRLLALQPTHAIALCVLATAHYSMGNIATAIATYRRCLQAKPDFAKALFNLGQILAAQGRTIQAVYYIEQALAARPDDPRILVELGNLLQDSDPQRSHDCFVRAHHLRPLTTWPAASAPADFAVLLIMAPSIANVPVTYLVGKSNYDAHFVSLLPGIDYDVEFLRDHADVVVNLVSDADQGRELLPLARELVERLERPVINHPDKIQHTDREEISALLSGTPGCRMPNIVSVSRAELASGTAKLDAFTRPVLLRVAGKHGGDDFEMVEDQAAITSFIARSPADEYYAIEYIDYRSADGFFRKYRLIFTDGGVYPYHLAICDHWKVHHYTTDMDKHRWMQDEELAFLRDPASVFSPANFATLRAIQAAVGLEHFGIDCSLDRNGELVVFEANASMLVHGDNTDFPYKDPYVAIIKAAFDRMLNTTARAAAGATA